MPYSIIRKSPKCWTVINTETGAVKAKCTSKKNAEAQRKLLYGVEHGWKPTRQEKGLKRGGRTQPGADLHPPHWVRLYNLQLELEDFRDSTNPQVSAFFQSLTSGNGQFANFYNQLRSVWAETPEAILQQLLQIGNILVQLIRYQFPNLPAYVEIPHQNVPIIPAVPPPAIIPNIEEEGGYLESFKRKPGRFPPSVRKLLKKIGDEKIKSLEIVRTPLSTFVSSLLNVISLGAYEKAVKESQYDSMFHLAMLINGKYVVEKNEVIKLYQGNPIKEKSETLHLSVSKSVSIKDLFENGRKQMGDMNFTNYDARSNNCQDFLLGLLSGSDLLTENARQFIKQDPEVVFKKMPSISEKIGRFITDVGAVGERAMEGEGLFKETWVIHGGRLVPILIGGEIPDDIHQLAKAKYELKKATEEYEKLLPEKEKPQILPKYERHQIPSLPPKKKYISEKKQMESPPRLERKEKKSKPSSSWREFYASAVKGKKFKNRQEVNAFMKECAKKYKEMKGK